MLRVFVAVLALSAVVAAIPAQQPSGPPWAHKLFLPDILQNPRQPPPPVLGHNFGAVPKGTLCKHTFTLTNIYDVPLQVIDTNPGCACLTAYPPQRVLQPTESAEFTVTMDTKVLNPGPNSRVLKVTVGGQDFQNTATFRFDVDARADVMLTPGELALGTVPAGGNKSASVLIDYQGRQPNWAVTGVVPAAGPLDVRVEPAGRNKYRLTAALKPNAAAGRVSERVSLTTTDPSLPVVQVPVTGVVLAPVTVSSATVTFDRPVRVGEKDERAVLVRSNNVPFQVRAVADPGDGVSVEPFGFAAPTQRVVIRFQPTRPGPVRKELRLETDLPGKPAVTVTVEAVAE
jgi:hypothetical protein